MMIRRAILHVVLGLFHGRGSRSVFASDQFGPVSDNLRALFESTVMIGTVYFLNLVENIDHAKKSR